jgi:tagatose-1,6-bisphosphate aldolase non-catalytic subunit AgaZ/GatZ
MNAIPLGEAVRRIYRLEERGERASLLGIGPMSRTVVKAALSLAKEKDFPVMLIASRNQVDAGEFGRGYVCGWDQRDFVKNVREIAKEIDFDGLCYICRDHGGPWQRDRERADRLPPAEAMEIAKRSYIEDLKAGFDLLHVDPTKDPEYPGAVPMDLVLERTVEIIEHVEAQRKALALPPISYEVGTEETNGGLTTESAYSEFIRRLSGMVGAKGLPMPLFIVGQTGTLTRLTANVGSFSPEFAKTLSAKAREYGVGLKEHNGDYLSDRILTMHPAIGITAVNVAPEYGVAETEAYLALHGVERKSFELGLLDSASDFYGAISREAVLSERWRKWLVGGDAEKSVGEALRDENLTRLITSSCGHYAFERPSVIMELGAMFKNLKSVGIEPESAVLNGIKRAVQRHSDCFGLNGTASKIMGLGSERPIRH